MGNQWGDIYLCVPQPKCWGDVSPRPPIIAARAKRPAHDSIALQTQQDPNAGNSRATIECRSV